MKMIIVTSMENKIEKFKFGTYLVLLLVLLQPNTRITFEKYV